MARLEIEHIIPLAQGGTEEESNLWLACPICNGHKSDKVSAVDPDTRRNSPTVQSAYGLVVGTLCMGGRIACGLLAERLLVEQLSLLCI